MKKFNTWKLYFPKLINLWGFISTYVIFAFQLQTSDKYFVIQFLGIGDDALVETSIFKLWIEWEDELIIHINIVFLFHLKYEKQNKYIIDIETDENQPWNFKK